MMAVSDQFREQGRQKRTFLEMLGGWLDKFEGDKLEATLLETGDDFADEVALDAVGLYDGGYDAQNKLDTNRFTLIMM